MRGLLHFLSIGFLAISFIACEPEVSFVEPQPAEKTDQTKFKSKFRGKYLCVEDSSILYVDKTSIVQKWHFEVESTQDSILHINHGEGDFKFDAEDEDLVIKPNKDSTHYIIDYKKVLFKISSTNVLKYDKGIYFLNLKNATSSWEVQILHFDTDGSLLLKDLELNEQDLEKLQSITEVDIEKDIDGDITEYRLHPTQKEWNEILKSGLFEAGERFVKIK